MGGCRGEMNGDMLKDVDPRREMTSDADPGHLNCQVQLVAAGRMGGV